MSSSSLHNDPMHLITASLLTELRIAAQAAGLGVRGKKKAYITELHAWISSVANQPSVLRHRLLLLKASLPRMAALNIDLAVAQFALPPKPHRIKPSPHNAPSHVSAEINTSWGVVPMAKMRFRIGPFYDLLKPIVIKYLNGRSVPQQFDFRIPDHELNLMKSNPNIHIALLVTYDDALYLSAHHQIDHQPCYAILESRALVAVSVNSKVLHFTKSPYYLIDKGKSDKVHPILLTQHIQLTNSPQLITIVSNPPKLGKLVAHIAVVHKFSPDQVLEKLKCQQISAADRITAIKSQYSSTDDDEIIGSTANISLLDPVMTTRIVMPLRTTRCKHLDTFCATTWLEMNAQTPTYLCPHCHYEVGSIPVQKSITPPLPSKLQAVLQHRKIEILVAQDVTSNLWVDMHFTDMLARIRSGVESVLLDVHTGLWEFPTAERVCEQLESSSITPPPKEKVLSLLDDSSEDEAVFQNESLTDAQCMLILSQVESGGSNVVIDLTADSDDESDMSTGLPSVTLPNGLDWNPVGPRAVSAGDDGLPAVSQPKLATSPSSGAGELVSFVGLEYSMPRSISSELEPGQLPPPGRAAEVSMLLPSIQRALRAMSPTMRQNNELPLSVPTHHSTLMNALSSSVVASTSVLPFSSVHLWRHGASRPNPDQDPGSGANKRRRITDPGPGGPDV